MGVCNMTQDRGIESYSNKTRSTYNYSTYKDRDLSILTTLQKEILMLKISGNTSKEIAEKLSVSVNTVGTLLQKARNKLDGKMTSSEKWYKKNREKVLQSRKLSREDPIKVKKRQETDKKYYAKNKERFSDYNKQYYQAHREEILLRQRERYKSKKMEEA